MVGEAVLGRALQVGELFLAGVSLGVEFLEGGEGGWVETAGLTVSNWMRASPLKLNLRDVVVVVHCEKL